jgi:predicted enzyme related to lactoylglutathione lyase
MENINKGFTRANHVGITVKNLEKSIAFYEALTGTKVSNIDEIGGERMAKTQGLKDTTTKSVQCIFVLKWMILMKPFKD